MKKNVIAFIALMLCIIFALIAVRTLAAPNHTVIVTGENNYNTKTYPVPLTIFPEAIPENVHVHSFSYYDYWHEVKDIYLELKFDTLTDMENYLINVKRECVLKHQEYAVRDGNDWFVEVRNQYNQSYDELFSKRHTTSSNEKIYTGYSIEVSPEKAIYKCNFGVISYSFDELTVIHSYVYGWYQKGVHQYIPKYFLRFNIPLEEEHQRLFYLED